MNRNRNRNRWGYYNGSGGIITRPASTRMLLIADPDAALNLTGANINAFHEQAEELVSFTADTVVAFWTRVSGELDGYGVARHGGDFCNYASPNTANGLLNKWIDSNGSHEATSGCVVLVFKPESVDNGAGWFSSRSAANIECGMVNDGADKFRFRVRNTGGGLEGPALPCALGQWHYAIMRWTSTHAYLSIDGGEEAALALGATGGVSNMNQRMEVLSDGGSGSRARGDFAELSIIDPADIADMEAFLTSNYPELA